MGRAVRARAAPDPAPPPHGPAGRRPSRLSAPLLECVANVSEGRDHSLISEFSTACGPVLLDVHADADHHRSVFTMAGDPAEVEAGARRLASAVITRLDVATHHGAHPRMGVLDVVPFVTYERWPAALPRLPGPAAIGARDRFGRWLSSTFAVPCFSYGPLGHGASRSLPDVRRHAFVDLAPETGPPAPDRRAGATAVGARGPLVAYNLWLEGADHQLARAVATALRSPAVRSLAFDLGKCLQVSCNLVDPTAAGPATVFDQVRQLLDGTGAHVEHCELVGLLPAAVLYAVAPDRWVALGLSENSTIEARLDRLDRPTDP